MKKTIILFCLMSLLNSLTTGIAMAQEPQSPKSRKRDEDIAKLKEQLSSLEREKRLEELLKLQRDTEAEIQRIRQGGQVTPPATPTRETTQPPESTTTTTATTGVPTERRHIKASALELDDPKASALIDRDRVGLINPDDASELIERGY